MESLFLDFCGVSKMLCKGPATVKTICEKLWVDLIIKK